MLVPSQHLHPGSACTLCLSTCSLLLLLLLLQIQGLPTMLFISPNDQKPVLRTEGLLPAETIKKIIRNEL